MQTHASRGPTIPRQPNQPRLEESARLFMLGVHGGLGQRRKYSGLPYSTHPLNVAEIVRSVPHTSEMIAAGYLHDVVSDSGVSIRDIERHFGPGVRQLVEVLTETELTSDGPRALRKRAHRERLAAASAEVQTIAVADMIDNARNIAESDPDFAAVYLPEKAALLAEMTKADSSLRSIAQWVLSEGFKTIGKTMPVLLH